MQPQFGEVESCSSPDAQLCTAVNGVQQKSEINHLKQPLYITVGRRLLLAPHFLNHRTSVSLRSSVTGQQLIREGRNTARGPAAGREVLLSIKTKSNSLYPSALSLMRRDTEVLRLRKCSVKRKRDLTLRFLSEAAMIGDYGRKHMYFI